MEVIVYKATSLSGKSYIGITSKSLKRRKIQHISFAKKGSPYKFHKALKKYSDGFDWEILKKVNSWKEAQNLEKYYIKKFDTFKKGYNSTLGGDGQLGRIFKHTPESIEKITKNHYWRGKSRPHSEETKKKISDSQKGKSKKPMKCSTKKKLSKLRKAENNPMFGKVAWNRGLPIEVRNKYSGEVQIFETQRDCATFLNKSQSSICNYLRGLQKHSEYEVYNKGVK